LLYDKLTPLEYLEFVAGLWGCGLKTPPSRGKPAAAAEPFGEPQPALREFFAGYAIENRAGGGADP
jgi:hypothetical protein